MRLFEASGYVNMPDLINTKIPFIFIFGGRGIGKTYGALKYIIESKRKFLFLRRTQSQIDLVGKPEFSPFKTVCADMGVDVIVKPITKYNSGFWMDDELIGYSAALSTLSNLRGFDASDIDLVIFDEFIPEKHERLIRNEGEAFLNMVETVGRNREIAGREPLQVVCLANANDIGNPIFMELNLINIVQRMKLKKQGFYLNKEKGLLIVNLDDSPISDAKRDTALYKLTSGSDFERMALDNEFIDDSIAEIKSRNLKEYRPIVAIAGVTIYKHKSDNKYYISEHKLGSPEEYTTAEAALEKFRRKYYYLWNAYLNRDIDFESKLCALLFERLW